jgi:hypothetical protein
MGKTVAILGGSMYTQYRCMKAVQCLVLPPGTTPAEGAACFVNPLTALGMVATMREEGHKALVHTGGRLQSWADAQQDLHQGQGRPGQYRAQARAGGRAEEIGATYGVRLERAHLHGTT